MKTYTCQVEITKRGAQRLRMKMRHAELNLKGATIIAFNEVERKPNLGLWLSGVGVPV